MKKLLISVLFSYFSFVVLGTIFGNWLHAAEPTKLLLHHFFVPNDVPQKQMLEPWAREVERLSNNQVEITN